ncbi:hypothetical protein HGRIS_002702 [Hohenbuehelia grisea]|uniref:Hemerythrin-like domain-containing protein n=1 Tax=Hohenbuehelia grisea TaxID=104357 RepID=A0ABR3JM79_9AGAR
MRSFHNSFKREFEMLYELSDGSYNKFGWSLTMYLSAIKRLKSGLTMHHTIEERHIFPKLAKRMPAFANTDDGAHWNSHRGIHQGISTLSRISPKYWLICNSLGLDDLSKLVTKFSEEPAAYNPIELRACFDGFRDVLFHHLDEEVRHSLDK